MNQSKFTLADVLNLIGTLAFGFVMYLSINFVTMGETITSIIWATIVSLVLGVLAFGAKNLKRTSRNFKTCIIWEGILLLLFVGIGFLAIFPFSHFFVVSQQRTAIKQLVIENLSQSEKLYTVYEKYANNRLGVFESRLNSVVQAKLSNPLEYEKYGFVADKDDNFQIIHHKSTLTKILFQSNYSKTKQEDSIWIAKAKLVINNWNPFNLIQIIKTAESQVTSTQNKLKEASADRAQGESAQDFDYSLTFANVSSQITNTSMPTLLGIFIALFLYILMLFSYFISPRHSKYPGLKRLFIKTKTNNNAL